MRYTAVFILLFLQGCCLTKQTPVKIRDSYYVCDKGQMVGFTTILFRDSTFVYNERGGLYHGVGQWKLSEDSRYLLLLGEFNDSISNVRIKNRIELKLSIKKRNAKVLVGDGCIFIRK